MPGTPLRLVEEARMERRTARILLAATAGVGIATIAAVSLQSGPTRQPSRATGVELSSPRVTERGPEVTGRRILSMGSQPASGAFVGNAAILEQVAGDYAASDDAMALARNAVMASCESYLITPRNTPGSVRLKAIAMRAASSDVPRMRSTFIAACQASPELLDDGDFRAAVERLAKSNETILNIAKRASALLASAHENETDKELVNEPSRGG